MIEVNVLSPTEASVSDGKRSFGVTFHPAELMKSFAVLGPASTAPQYCWARISYNVNGREIYDGGLIRSQDPSYKIEQALLDSLKISGQEKYVGSFDVDALLGGIVRDKSGRQLHVGDHIVYPSVSASSGFLKFGRVVELRPAIDNEGHDKVVVIGEFNGRNSYYEGGEQLLNGKPSTLQHPYRCLAIDMRMIPPTLFKLMDAYEIKPPKPRKKKKF